MRRIKIQLRSLPPVQHRLRAIIKPHRRVIRYRLCIKRPGPLQRSGIQMRADIRPLLIPLLNVDHVVHKNMPVPTLIAPQERVLAPRLLSLRRLEDGRFKRGVVVRRNVNDIVLNRQRYPRRAILRRKQRPRRRIRRIRQHLPPRRPRPQVRRRSNGDIVRHNRLMPTGIRQLVIIAPNHKQQIQLIRRAPDSRRIVRESAKQLLRPDVRPARAGRRLGADDGAERLPAAEAAAVRELRGDEVELAAVVAVGEDLAAPRGVAGGAAAEGVGCGGGGGVVVAGAAGGWVEVELAAVGGAPAGVAEAGVVGGADAVEAAVVVGGASCCEGDEEER